MRSTLILTALLGFLFVVGCGPKAVEFDAEKTVKFDKDRDGPETLKGPGTPGATKKSGKGLNAK